MWNWSFMVERIGRALCAVTEYVSKKHIDTQMELKKPPPWGTRAKYCRRQALPFKRSVFQLCLDRWQALESHAYLYRDGINDIYEA